MADTKLSAIATSASNLVAADQIVGVNSGTTDLLFSGTQIKAFTSASPVLVTPNLGTPSAGVMTNVTGTAAGLTAGNVTTNANLTGVITSSGNATSIASQTGTGTKFVVDTSPTLVTPVLGVSAGTSLTLGGGSIGSDALEVTGTSTHNGNLSVVSGSFITSGNLSAAAWTTNGLRNQMAAASYTDTSSSGTVTNAYTDLFGASTILSSSATTYTNYYGAFFKAPVASTNVTMTNKAALGADSISIGGAAQGANALAVTGTITSSGNITSSSGQVVGSSFIGVSSLTGSIFLRNGSTVISSPVNASLQFGNADVDTNAGIVAQILRSQGALAGGTSDQAGKNWTFLASPGKGTGAGGQIILQTAPAGTTGTSVNAAATGLTITAPVSTMQPSVVLGNQAIATNASDGFLYAVSGAGTPTGTPTTFTGRVPIYVDTTNSQLWMYLGGAWKQPKTPAAAAIVTWQ